jgi:hypothetical protein
MTGPALLEKSGAQASQKPVYTPIFISRFFEGMYSNRATLHNAASGVEEIFYSKREGSILSGLNVEMSVRNTPIRRYGSQAFSTFLYPTPPLISYSLELLNGNLQVLVDTGSVSSVLSAVGNSSGNSAVYTGTFPSAAGSNGWVGLLFTITGFQNANNNGVNFLCTASSTTQLTLSNPIATAETHAGVSETFGAFYYDQQNGSATLLWAKQSGAGQTSGVGVAGNFLAGDGVQTHQYTPFNPNGTVWTFGLQAPTQQPKVKIVESGSASVQWHAATQFTAMGLIFDTANNAVYQLQSVDANNDNTTQFSNTGNGQPAWNNSPGGTTSDNTVTWTNWGPLTAWQANFTYNNASIGGTLVNPAAIFDPASGGIFLQSNPGNASGKSGSIRPTFKAAKGFTVQDGGIKWIYAGGVISTWKSGHAYNKIGTVSFDDSNSFIIEPSGIQNGLPTNVTLFLQACTTAGTSNSSATSPFSATTNAVGTLTTDGDLQWLSLGGSSWAATTPYAGWSANGTIFSALKDANNNEQVCIQTGTSATVQPGTSYSITSVSNASGGNTVYHYSSTTAMPIGSSAFPVFAVFSGFAQSANNGTFKIVSSTATSVTVANASGVSDTTGTAIYNPWAINYGGTTNDGTCVFSMTGTALGQTWTANQTWYLPIGGFAPPTTAQPYGGASVIDSNANVEFVINNGLSGGSAPSWNASIGGYTDDAGTSLVLTQVTVSGTQTTYTGTITGGGSNAFAGQTFLISGFSTAGNNILINVTSSSGTTLVCTTSSQVSETHSGAAKNGLIWLNLEAFSSNSLAWSFGLCYAYAFKSRSTEDFYSTVSSTTNALPVPPGLQNALPAPTGALDGSISSTSPFFQIVGSNTGAVNYVSGFGSTNPAIDTIVLYRSADSASGSADMFELTEIPAPQPIGGVPQPWTFADFLPSTPTTNFPGLNILEPAPTDGVNNPCPSTALPQAFNYSRIWCSDGEQVIWSGGPDTLVGSPFTAFNAADEFSYLGEVVKLIRTPVGLITFLNESVEVILGGPSTASFYTTTLCPSVGLGNINGATIFSGEIYFMSNNNQLRVLSPSLSLGEPGFAVADQLALFNPKTAYVTFFDETNPGTPGLYVGTGSSTVNGLTGYLRMNPRQMPGLSQPESCWSTFAAVSGGLGMIQAVQTAPGVTNLLLGGTSGGLNINQRDTAIFTDNVAGTPTQYDANYTIGALWLANPGELAALHALEFYFSGASYAPTVSYLINEISGSFTPFTLAPQFSPPSLYGTTVSPTSYSPNRYFFLGTASVALCMFIQLKIDLGTTSNINETFGMAIMGKILKNK